MRDSMPDPSVVGAGLEDVIRRALSAGYSPRALAAFEAFVADRDALQERAELAESSAKVLRAQIARWLARVTEVEAERDSARRERDALAAVRDVWTAKDAAALLIAGGSPQDREGMPDALTFGGAGTPSGAASPSRGSVSPPDRAAGESKP